MRKKIAVFALCVGIVAFLGAGIWLALHCVQTTKYYQTAIKDAEQKLTAIDSSGIAAMETKTEMLLENNAYLQEELGSLQEENARLAAEEALLQQEHDALEQQEDTVFYRTILESLKEGMKRVEEYTGDQ